MNSVSGWFRSWTLLGWRSAAVTLVVVYAVVGFFVVPWIVKGQIEKQTLSLLKRQATVEQVRCNPFTLSMTIEGFSLPDRPGLVLLSWDRVYANAQLSSLFRWAATLKEFRIENPYVAMRRFEDGAVNILELMDDVDLGRDETDDDGFPRALLQHIEVIDGRIDIEDRARPDPLLWEYGPAKVTLVDISTIPESEGSNDVVLGLPSQGELRVNGTVVLDPLGLDGRFALENVSLGNTWKAIHHLFEFDLTSGRLDLDATYSVTFDEAGLSLTVDDADLQIAEVGFRAESHDQDLIRVGSLTVTGGHLEWPEQRATAESVVVDEASVFGWVQADGTPSWNVLVPKESQEQIVETYQTLEEKIRVSAEVGRFEIRNSGMMFEDATSTPPVRFTIEDANLVVTDISTTQGSMWPVEMSATNATGAEAWAKGAFGAAPLAVDVEVGLKNLDLAKYQPYVARFAPLDLRAGVFEISGAAKASKVKGEEKLQASFTGGFDVIGLDLNETVTGDKLVGWGDLKVAGIDAKLDPMSAMVREVDINKAGLEINVAEDGSINLLEFFNTISENGEGMSGSGQPLPSLTIARFRLHDCFGRYTDKTVPGHFSLALIPINGTITGIATDTTAGATVDIDARIESGGSVLVGGQLDPLDYQRLTDLSIDVRDMDLPAVSPMSVKFTGFPITSGDVELDLDYDISDRYLTAVNHIEADDLVLGDKVEGEGQINLPMKLGVSLLKDKEGRIVLDVPFEGSFDDPGFGMATAAGAAAKEIMGELVKSPFKLLGKIGSGGGDRDLEFVEFPAGRATLEDRATEKLDALASGLGERPTLLLVVHGGYDSVVDSTGLQLAAFREELAARGVSEEEFETIIPLQTLESMYSSTLSAGDLDGLRERHTLASDGGEVRFDEVAYRGDLRTALVAAQPVDNARIQALAPERAAIIRNYLVETMGLDSARVSVAKEAEAIEPDEPDTAAKGSENRVRCRLELSGG